MVQRSKFSLGYYLMIFLFILFLETMFFSGPAVKDLPYSKFRDLIQKNKIESVILESDRIYGLLKSEQAPPKAAPQTNTATKKTDTEKGPLPPKPGFTPQQKQTPWYLNFEKNLSQSEKTRRQEILHQFTVVRLADPKLLEVQMSQEMEKAKIQVEMDTLQFRREQASLDAQLKREEMATRVRVAEIQAQAQLNQAEINAESRLRSDLTKAGTDLAKEQVSGTQ